MVAAVINGKLRILRRKQVEDRSGLSRSTIYARLNPKSPYYDPNFPKPIALGSGTNPPVGWLEHEIDAYLTAQVEKCRGFRPVGPEVGESCGKER